MYFVPLEPVPLNGKHLVGIKNNIVELRSIGTSCALCQFFKNTCFFHEELAQNVPREREYRGNSSYRKRIQVYHSIDCFISTSNSDNPLQ